MIGMPRITLIRPALSFDKAGTVDTRINAQIRPSTVDSISEPIVTRIVSATPCSRIGRNSAASVRKRCMEVAWRRNKPAPLIATRAVGLKLQDPAP